MVIDYLSLDLYALQNCVVGTDCGHPHDYRAVFVGCDALYPNVCRHVSLTGGLTWVPILTHTAAVDLDVHWPLTDLIQPQLGELQMDHVYTGRHLYGVAQRSSTAGSLIERLVVRESARQRSAAHPNG